MRKCFTERTDDSVIDTDLCDLLSVFENESDCDPSHVLCLFNSDALCHNAFLAEQDLDLWSSITLSRAPYTTTRSDVFGFTSSLCRRWLDVTGGYESRTLHAIYVHTAFDHFCKE